jgi:hypothetical protein
MDLAPIIGGGQIAVVNEAYPQPFSARTTDASGAPVGGVPIHFFVDQCVSIADDRSLCPDLSAYPTFPGGAYDVVATSNANGVAVTPPLTAGADAGPFRVVASIFPVDAGAMLHAYFPLQQVAQLSAVPIGAAVTGAWYDPAQSGHGLLIEVLPNDRLLAYWFTFTPDGSQQAWFGGVGTIVGNQAIV